MRKQVGLHASAVALSLALSACGHPILAMSRPRTTPATVNASEASFTVFHGGRDDGVYVTFFDRSGRVLCQTPPRSRCTMQLPPGQHRIYVAWDEFTDAFDLEAAPGRRYHATVVAAWGFVNEKLTPSSEGWSRLEEFMAMPDVELDSSVVPTASASLGDLESRMRSADRRLEGLDDRHLEVHTIRPDDGI